MVTLVLGLALIAALGGGAWWMLGRDPATPRDEAVEPAPLPPRGDGPEEAASTPAEKPPPAADVPWEAIASAGEEIPEVMRPPTLVFAIPKEIAMANEGFIRGSDLREALVAARIIPVRFDSEETRTRFRKARFPMPPPMATPEGVPGLMLMQMSAVFRRADDFSARLDRKALWIGAKGVY
jgi:hypothetical protein